MKHRGTVAVALGMLALAGLFCFSYVIPIEHASGVIDVTQTLCLPTTQPVSKRYHILFGELNDYHLVTKHIVTAPSAKNCGQRASFRLYL